MLSRDLGYQVNWLGFVKEKTQSIRCQFKDRVASLCALSVGAAQFLDLEVLRSYQRISHGRLQTRLPA